MRAINKFICILFLLLISFGSSADNLYRVKTSNQSHLNVRKSPNGEIIGQIKNGNYVNVYEFVNSWAKIEFQKGTAYVNSDYLVKVDSVSTQKSTVKQEVPQTKNYVWKKIWKIIKFLIGAAIVIGCIYLFFTLLPYIILFVIVGGIAALLTHYLFDKAFIGWIIGGVVIIYSTFQYYDLSLFKILYFPFYPIALLFRWLNYAQYFLQAPWRYFFKKYNSFLPRTFRKSSITPVIRHIFISIFYIICLPLRIVNAVYYNMIVRTLMGLKDVLSEIIAPKLNGMRFKQGFDYLWHWLLRLFNRVAIYMARWIIIIIENILATIHDIIFPTLTLYHGTSEDASVSITKPGTWLVGGGNYAGSGIYFGITLRTAMHYSQGVIIVSRVTLGKIINLSMTPSYIRNCVGPGGGDKITKWGLKHGYNTTEWWRVDGSWWEYCLLDEVDNYDESWRIRPIFVRYYDSESRFNFKRIWGGMAFWYFSKYNNWK